MFVPAGSVDEESSCCSAPTLFDLTSIRVIGEHSQIDLGLQAEVFDAVGPDGHRQFVCFAATGSGKTANFLKSMFSRRGRLDIDRLLLALQDPASLLGLEREGLCGQGLPRYFLLGRLRGRSLRGIWTQYLVVLLRELLESARSLVRSRAARLFRVGESPGHLVATHPRVTRGPTSGWLMFDTNQPAGSAVRV